MAHSDPLLGSVHATASHADVDDRADTIVFSSFLLFTLFFYFVFLYPRHRRQSVASVRFALAINQLSFPSSPHLQNARAYFLERAFFCAPLCRCVFVLLSSPFVFPSPPHTTPFDNHGSFALGKGEGSSFFFAPANLSIFLAVNFSTN